MNEHIEELFPFYALDALSAEEKAQVDAYVATNPEAQARLDEMLETADFLPFEPPPVAPRPEVKAKLMARVQMDKELNAVVEPPAPAEPTFGERLQAVWRRFQMSPALPVLAGLAVVVAVIAAGQARQMRNEVASLAEQTAVLQDQITQQQATITDLEIDIAEQADELESQQLTVDTLREQLADQEGTLALLTEPDAQLVHIASLSGDATGQLLFEEGGETAVFLVANLPDLGENETYQAWFIKSDGSFLNVGQLPTSPTGHTTQVELDQPVHTFAAVGVSVEQKADSDSLIAPTDVVMVGEIALAGDET